MTDDELIDTLKEFYDGAFTDGEMRENDFEENLRWALADKDEIDLRL